MDHKILILGITIFIVILLLSFRKEKYAEVNQEPEEGGQEEEEQEKREQLVEDAYDLKTLLAQINDLQADDVDKEKAVNAFYDDIYSNTKYGPSAEEAGEAYNKEVEKQMYYLQTWLKLARGVEPGKEEKARDYYQAQLDAHVAEQAREWFGENYADEGFDKILGKKSIVKIENNIGAIVDEGKYIPWYDRSIKEKTWYPNLRPVGYSSLMSQATGDPFYQTTSGLYHKEDSSILNDGTTLDANEYWMMVPRCGARSPDGEASCLDKDGVADKYVPEDGIPLNSSLSYEGLGDAWATCASACVNSPTDECSGFSLSIKDNKYRCKLTRDKYEDIKLKKIDNEIKIGDKTFLTGEDVYAIHEGYYENDWASYLKNPLYAKFFSGVVGGNDTGKNIGDLLTKATRGSGVGEDTINERFDSEKAGLCNWRTVCQAKYTAGTAVEDLFCEFDSSGKAQYFGEDECENPKKIENDGLPKNCEGNWLTETENPAEGKHLNGCPTKGPSGALGNKPCFNSDPNESDFERKLRRPTYTKRFSASGVEAINGGSCPQGVSTSMLCRDGINGEEGNPLQICEYPHGGWYETPPINCGTSQFGEPGVVSVNQVKLGDCEYKTECPTYGGYKGGSISGIARVIDYDDQGKQPKDGGKSCYDVIKQKIVDKDPSWNGYGIEGNDIVYKCQKTCPEVAAPPPPASCNTSDRGGTCTNILKHGKRCYEECPKGNVMDYSKNGEDYGWGVAKALYCNDGTLSYQPTQNVSCKPPPGYKDPGGPGYGPPELVPFDPSMWM